MNHNSSNPFASPEHVDSPKRAPVSIVLRGLSIGAFGCGFVAFMAYYGYAASMNPTWLFLVLPILAVLACSLSLAALAGPWQPSVAVKWSKSIIALGAVFPLACFGLAAALNATTKYGTHTYLPRIIMFFVATTALWIASEAVHGHKRGRRLACIGYGFGVLQCLGSVVDFLYTEWSF